VLSSMRAGEDEDELLAWIFCRRGKLGRARLHCRLLLGCRGGLLRPGEGQVRFFSPFFLFLFSVLYLPI
jgi:hypothetical protein